jgi:PhnB protein
MQLEPYLFFDGDCEEALAFYKGVFGGEITSLHRFEGSPLAAQLPPEYKTKIMHAGFKAADLHFMASDGMPGTPRPEGSRIALSLGTRDAGIAADVFEKLAEGGSITMPLQDTFWGAKFGMVIDKFGIEWMLNCEKKSDS